MTTFVKTEVVAGIMTLTLARADKKNTFSSAMYSALSNGLERAEKDPAVRVVVFQGMATASRRETISPISVLR
jgi:enoyl-CoA hydratase/carnithine racemase